MCSINNLKVLVIFFINEVLLGITTIDGIDLPSTGMKLNNTLYLTVILQKQVCVNEFG